MRESKRGKEWACCQPPLVYIGAIKKAPPLTLGNVETNQPRNEQDILVRAFWAQLAVFQPLDGRIMRCRGSRFIPYWTILTLGILSPWIGARMEPMGLTATFFFFFFFFFFFRTNSQFNHYPCYECECGYMFNSDNCIIPYSLINITA